MRLLYSGGSRGGPCVPWNPSFEGLPSKILTLEPALQLHSSNNARVSAFFISFSFAMIIYANAMDT